MAEMSQRAFARHIGVTLRAVQKAIASKRIALNANGKIDADAAVIAWRRNTDEGRKSFTDLSRQRFPEGALATLPPADPDDDAGDDPENADLPAAAQDEDPHMREYRAARAARERTRSQREQIELDQLRGTLIDVAEAQRLAFTALRTVRDAVMNIAVRVMDELAAETDPARVQQRIEEELASALGAVDRDTILREVEMEDSDGSD